MSDFVYHSYKLMPCHLLIKVVLLKNLFYCFGHAFCGLYFHLKNLNGVDLIVIVQKSISLVFMF